jgi:hypothetical protein
MTLTIALNSTHITHLDLSPIRTVIEKFKQQGAIASADLKISFQIDYERDANDPREVSEIPAIRLWFLRLDAAYPWIVYLLDWQAGELARYAAMLVPHQFSRSHGIEYNPEALEIFVMQKIFVLTDWLQQQGISTHSRIKAMAQLLGYELEDSFLDLICK